MAEPGAAEVEPRPVGEPRGLQVGNEHEELDDDAERRAEAEQGLGAGGEAAALLLSLGRSEGDQVGREDGHRHHVVRDRRPHHRAEPATGVEHLPDQHEHPVEEHLRQAVAREVDHRLALLGQLRCEELRVQEQAHQQRSSRHERHGHNRQEQAGEGDDAVGVGLAAVRVVLHRPHQLRHEYGVHDAARQQDVEHVRDGVGDVEHIGVQADAERRGEQDAADEAAQPGHHRPGGHHRSRGQQRS